MYSRRVSCSDLGMVTPSVGVRSRARYLRSGGRRVPSCSRELREELLGVGELGVAVAIADAARRTAGVLASRTSCDVGEESACHRTTGAPPIEPRGSSFGEPRLIRTRPDHNACAARAKERPGPANINLDDRPACNPGWDRAKYRHPLGRSIYSPISGYTLNIPKMSHKIPPRTVRQPAHTTTKGAAAHSSRRAGPGTLLIRPRRARHIHEEESTHGRHLESPRQLRCGYWERSESPQP